MAQYHSETVVREVRESESSEKHYVCGCVTLTTWHEGQMGDYGHRTVTLVRCQLPLDVSAHMQKIVKAERACESERTYYGCGCVTDTTWTDGEMGEYGHRTWFVMRC